MFIRLADLVARFGGQLKGDPRTQVSGFAPLDEAGEGHATFLTNPRLRRQADACRAAVLILSPSDDDRVSAYAGARIVTPNPYAYFAYAAQYFQQLHAAPHVPGIHPSACVDDTARVAGSARIGPHVTVEAHAEIGENCVIDAGCFIGKNARIGAETRLQARVVFHAGCVIGARGEIRSGAVIGSEGFGFANDKGVWVKIPQTGGVVIGDDVQIGANTTIDRGTLSDTIIEDGVKLDNQIQIGHNCRVGAHSAMAGCVGVAGSAIFGRHVTIGGAAMIGGHLTIADGVHVSASSVVQSSIPEKGAYTGFYPLEKHTDWEKTAVVLRNLTALRQRVKELEKTIRLLTETGK
ncbi:MAG: UDP-3-O-(3-hydroxymyristoyl)glucosamine N-acyltransferase [Burkholderiaceae bacterium]|jgi:UDP-3-O-[3-hydroxymyristoyl] glucosamine N-acyltransferase|nr:UDP-3-O-(3-hydroxymyristoyl)glucosamine N-acyltransferase [Burkholderiaceae bacterium]